MFSKGFGACSKSFGASESEKVTDGLVLGPTVME